MWEAGIIEICKMPVPAIGDGTDDIFLYHLTVPLIWSN